MLEIKNIDKLKGVQLLDGYDWKYTVIDIYPYENVWYMFKVNNINGVVFTVRLRRTPNKLGLYRLISNSGMRGNDFRYGNATVIDIDDIKDCNKFKQILTDLI
jgi:hypothetical protein